MSDAPEWPALGGGGVTLGIGPGQYQTKRTASQSFAVASQTVVAVTWPAPFADTNYTPIAALVDEAGSGCLTLTNTVVQASPTLSGGYAILNKTAAGFQVVVWNVDSTNPHPGHIEAFAIHD